MDDPMDDLDMLEDMEQPQPPEDEDVDLGEAGRNWVRPEVPAYDPATTALGAFLRPRAPRGGRGAPCWHGAAWGWRHRPLTLWCLHACGGNGMCPRYGFKRHHAGEQRDGA